MRLKHRDHSPARIRLSRRRERRRDFGRVMRVVIDDCDATCFPEPLEAPAHTVKLGQRLRARL